MTQYEIREYPEREGFTWAVIKPYEPDEHADNPLRNKGEIVAFYPTREAAEFARRSLLGELTEDEQRLQDARDATQDRYETARQEADERLALANKHNERHYWLAADAAAQDATELANIYRVYLTPEEQAVFDLRRIEEGLRWLAAHAA